MTTQLTLTERNSDIQNVAVSANGTGSTFTIFTTLEMSSNMPGYDESRVVKLMNDVNDHLKQHGKFEAGNSIEYERC